MKAIQNQNADVIRWTQKEYPTSITPTPLWKTALKVFGYFLATITVIPLAIIILYRVAKKSIWYAIMPQLGYRLRTEEDWKNVKVLYPDAQRVEATTPDKKTLDGVFIPGSKHRKKIIIYTPERKGSWEKKVKSPTIEMLRETGASVLIVNSRGVGKSKMRFWKYPSCEELAMDVFTVWMGTKTHLGCDLQKDVMLYGRSLGGGIGLPGTAMTEMHTGKRLNVVAERTFSSLSEEVYQFSCKLFFGWKWIGRLAARILTLIGISMNSTEALKNISGRKVIVYHERDDIIPHEANLATGVLTDLDEHDNVSFIPMDTEPTGRPEHDRKLVAAEKTAVVQSIQRMLDIAS